MKKTILGLDLGTNSIGWALIRQNFESKEGEILGMGSRIIPMSQDILGDFGKGNSVSQTAERTGFRSVRRLRERYLLRRERLHRVLNILGFLPNHYAAAIDFQKRLGKFKEDEEPKLVYKPVWNDAKNKQEFEFIFKDAFAEMITDFAEKQPQLLINKHGEPALIPYDWTIYYLRKKALTQKIAKKELAWIILNFNQKRGYYQLRGEEDQDATRTSQTRIYFDTQIISEITDTGAVYKGLKVINIKLSNGDTGKYFAKELPNWIGVKKNIIATIDLDKDGNDRLEDDGALKRRFSIPTEDDWDKKWKLVKIKTEKEIGDSQKTVGSYIYDTLLQNPRQKIKGKLVRTIERKFYKEELKAILEKQIAFHPELQNDEIYNDCVRELYRNNEAHQIQLSAKGFAHLILNDIIFYQRPLRSQKSSIGNCSLEFHRYKDKEGQWQKQYLKAIPKSNPYYQEFRIWQWMYNLSIYKKDNDDNVTQDFLATTKDWESLSEFLNDRKEIKQSELIEHLLKRKLGVKKLPKAEGEKYRWNYVEDKEYPLNETRGLIKSRIQKLSGIPKDFLTREIEQQLWHIIFSVTDKVDYEKALKTFAIKHQLEENAFVDLFRKFPPFKSEYGSFSEKAIKKLLPLMRLGKYWDEQRILEHNAVYLKNIKRVLEKLSTKSEAISEKDKEDWNKSINNKLEAELMGFMDGDVQALQGLRLHIAQYLVYGRHAEAAVAGRWNSVEDIEQYLKEFRQHSLRNPIVEQVITETLRVVKDIWKSYGDGANNFFDEIHIELGRDLKNPADKRKDLTNKVTANENTNLRIKSLLIELQNDIAIENVRPYSPMQQEILKIYEDGVLNSDIEVPDDILKISKTAQPSSSDLQRYKLWLEQKYRSPYTGIPIPLSRLFTPEYEIEHIIPQSRYFDDSLSNKVICEAAVNKLKDNQIGLAFIKKHHGEIVPTGLGKTVQIYDVDAYELYVKQNFDKNRSKRNKLLLEEIPEKMIERQMNDTRYISKFISGLLSNIVRAESNDDGVNSKNLIPCNGKITTELKQDWGLNDVWNDLVLPRFERMNQITNSTLFTVWNENHKKYLPTVPLDLSKGFSKKRIDHRHHAMDALVIACATRDHVNLLNNQSARSDTRRYDLQNKLRRKQPYFNEKEQRQKDAFRDFIKPWDSLTQAAREALENIVVSFKQNLRVVNKSTNKYEKWVEVNGEKVKERQTQSGINWAVRKSLHKDTVSGKVQLPRIKVPNGKILTATRKSLDTSFDLKAIGAITDTGIQKILKCYLKAKDGNPDLAFSPEGLEDLNKNVAQYNDGKYHQPIYKVRVYELGSKFPLGQTGNKKDKYVEAAKGTNLFFAVYGNGKGKRSFETIPFNEVVERQKQGLGPAPDINHKGDSLLFTLSPDDLVYVPTPDEWENATKLDDLNFGKERKERIYKVEKASGTECYFVRHDIAFLIKQYDAKTKWGELESQNKLQTTMTPDRMKIADHCVKITLDRLGNIRPAKDSGSHFNGQPTILRETDVSYGKRTIKKFDSFEAMEDEQLAYYASLSPEELLRNHKLLSMAAFGIKDEKSIDQPDRKIKF